MNITEITQLGKKDMIYCYLNSLNQKLYHTILSFILSSLLCSKLLYHMQKNLADRFSLKKNHLLNIHCVFLEYNRLYLNFKSFIKSKEILIKKKFSKLIKWWISYSVKRREHFTMAVAMLSRGSTFYHGCSYVVKGENILPWL